MGWKKISRNQLINKVVIRIHVCPLDLAGRLRIRIGENLAREVIHPSQQTVCRLGSAAGFQRALSIIAPGEDGRAHQPWRPPNGCTVARTPEASKISEVGNESNQFPVASRP